MGRGHAKRYVAEVDEEEKGGLSCTSLVIKRWKSKG